AAGDRPHRLAERDRSGRRRVLDVRDRDAGQTELLHPQDGLHRRVLHVADVGFPDVAEGEARVGESLAAGLAHEARDRDALPGAEGVHPDADDRDLAHHAAGRNRYMRIARPSLSSPTGSRTISILIPMRKSVGPPRSTDCTRGPSSRSIWPAACPCWAVRCSPKPGTWRNVHVYSVPRGPRRTSSTSSDRQRAHVARRG